uniref:B30.2/SPRY domain-containing protein n=1 Tax=Trichobilharzia regenti TaxID=157069 RepID=A0AA85JF98_TRIRE|nr:unnamed protein product [Trichobilharzia regenti]
MAFSLDDDKRCQLNEDIIKQLYLVAYMQGSKLPTCLVTNSKCSKVQVRGDGRTAVDMRSHVHQTVLPVVIKADNPIPVSCSVYYFEVTVNVKSRSGLLALGVCSSRSSTNEWPGMEFTSYGYHSNSGTIYHNSKELPVSAPGFSETDIIGCGVNFVNNSVFFTKNGVFIGPVNAGKKLPHPVYPCIAFACPNCHVSINFGHHKFAFDIGQYISRERAVAISTAVDRKCNDQLAYVTMRNLVATYLLHNGFLESAQALGEWVTKASTDQSNTTGSIFSFENDISSDNNNNNMCYSNGKSSSKSLTPDTPNGCLSTSTNKFIQRMNSLTNSLNANGYSDCNSNNNAMNTNINNNSNCSGSIVEETNGGDHYLKHSEQQYSQSAAIKSLSAQSTVNHHDLSSLSSSSSSSKNASQANNTVLNDLFCWPEAVDILLRRRYLRETIRNGDYLSALDQLQAHFKTLWENDPSITFVLKCHHFIDLIRRHYTVNSSKEPVYLNNATHSNSKVFQCNGVDVPRNSQKHTKPSSSVESSPEITNKENNCQFVHLLNSNHNNITNLPVDNNDDNSSSTSTGNTINRFCRPIASSCHPSHSPTSYQAPVRLRLESLTPEWNNDSLLSSSDRYNSEPLPSVFPKTNSSFNDIVNTTTNGSGTHTPGVINNSSSEVISSHVVPSTYSTENNFMKANSEIITNGNSTFSSYNSSPISPMIKSSIQSNQCINGDNHHNNDDHDHDNINNNNNMNSHHVTTTTTNNNNQQNGIHDDNNSSSSNNNNNISNTITNNHFVHHIDSDHVEVNYSASVSELYDLIEYGRSLRSNALELQHQGAISLEQLLFLSSAFSLVAYQNPYRSPLSGLLHPKHRELLADAVNDAILVHLKQPSRPVLDIALTYLEHVLTDEGTSCKNTGSFPCYRFKNGHSNPSTPSNPLQTIGSQQLQCDDVFTATRVSQANNESTTPVTRGTPTTPSRTTVVSGSRREGESRYATADVQTYGLASGDFTENSNGSTNLLRPASTSVISSSLYVPPSALISLTGRSNPVTRSSDSQRSSSRVRPTSLQNLIQQRRQSQSTDQPTASSPSPSSSSSHFNRFLITSSNWPVSTPVSSASTTTTTTSQNPNRFSPSRITVTSSLTNTHAPTGPELAGFFHPILFIG